jgi:hypothetical protein
MTATLPDVGGVAVVEVARGLGSRSVPPPSQTKMKMLIIYG